MGTVQNNSVKKYVYAEIPNWYTPEVTSLEQMCTTKNCCNNNVSIKNCIEKGCANCLLNKTIFATQSDSNPGVAPTKKSKDAYRYTLVLQRCENPENPVIIILMNPSKAGKIWKGFKSRNSKGECISIITADDTITRTIELLGEEYDKLTILNVSPYMNGDSKCAKEKKLPTNIDVTNKNIVKAILNDSPNCDIIVATGKIKSNEILKLFLGIKNVYVLSSYNDISKDENLEKEIQDLATKKLEKKVTEKISHIVNQTENIKKLNRLSNEIKKDEKEKTILVKNEYSRHISPPLKGIKPYYKVPISISKDGKIEINHTKLLTQLKSEK